MPLHYCGVKKLKKVADSEVLGMAGKLTGACMKGMAEVMPPNFCWKDGEETELLPTVCPPGYFRSLGMCLQQCKSGYSSDGALLCKENCSSGYDTNIVSCFKNVFNWHIRDVYFPHTLTNFSDSVKCGEGLYKFGGICYKDCNVIGMENCGIAACSVSPGECASAIVGIIVDVISGIIDLGLFFASFGASTAITGAKNAIKNGIKKIGMSAVKRAVKSAVRSVTGKFRKVFVKQAINKVQANAKRFFKGHLLDSTKDGFRSTFIYTFCNEVFAIASSKVNGQNYIDSSTLINAVIGGASAFDPTGILTIGAAFLHQSCYIPSVIPEPEVDQTELAKFRQNSGGVAGNPDHVNMNGTVPEGCIQLFEHSYSGFSATYCNDTTEFASDHNNRYSSFILGPNTSIVFYDQKDYKGDNYFSEEPYFDNLTENGWNDRISSLIIAKTTDRVVLYDGRNYSGYVWMYRKGTRISWLTELNDRIESIKIGKNVSLTTYVDGYMKGTRNNFTEDSPDLNSLNNQISSLIVN